MKMKLFVGLLVLLVVSCNQVQEEEFDLEGINWKGVKQCFEDAKALVPEIKEVIALIKQFKFGKAWTLIQNLVKKGVKVVKDCVNRFRKKSLGVIKKRPVLPTKPKKVIDFCELKYRRTHKNATIEEIHEAPEYKECKEKMEKIKKEREECLKKCEEIQKPFGKKLCEHKCKRFRPFKPVKPVIKKEVEAEVEAEPTLEFIPPIRPTIPFPKPFPLPIPNPIPFPKPHFPRPVRA